MAIHTRRREFIFTLGGAAVAWPLAARAQQAAMPVVGFLSAFGRHDRSNWVEAFRRGLHGGGFVDGRDVAIEYRFAENQRERLPALAADLVGRKVAAIVATGGVNVILAAKASTTTIPIVFTFGGDPVKEGFVTSLNRPGANVTGVTFFNTVLTGKVLGLLHELLPNAAVIALMVNPNNRESSITLADAQEAARTLSWQLLVFNASTPNEIDVAFSTLRQHRVDALVVASDPFFSTRRQQMVALVTREAIPNIGFSREWVADGGLMGYGNDVADVYRRAGLYTARILKGENAADLPVDQATRFEFLINLKTAKALGIDVPPTLLARADEVIE
jgi:putative tryptophan/tyrosine transport system substrate-binding protein